MSQTISDTIVSAARIDLATMVKNEVWNITQNGTNERIAARSVAKAMEKSQAYILLQLEIASLPMAIVGILKKNPIASHVALSIWKRTGEDVAQSVRVLNRAIKAAKAEGSSKVMLKHAA